MLRYLMHGAVDLHGNDEIGVAYGLHGTREYRNTINTIKRRIHELETFPPLLLIMFDFYSVFKSFLNHYQDCI